MSYFLTGSFIEACDCTVICPCWVDDDPVGGHCTGLIAWHLDSGSLVNGVPMDDRSVVSVSTHLGNRRDGSNTTTMLYVDSAASDEQFGWLTQAFSGLLEGPVADLAEVSGLVAGSERAAIAIQPATGGAGTDEWAVVVTALSSADVSLVHALGSPKVFPGETEPLTLTSTALSKELGVPPAGAVVAQDGKSLAVNVGALPAGTLTVTGRSGMRGKFRYRFADSVGGLGGPLEGSPAAADRPR